jgi:soluble lytic murein transglycosylase-like protein
MIDSISEIQSRISDIQGKISSLATSLPASPPPEIVSGQPTGTFAQALAGQQAPSADVTVPPASLGPLPALVMGRKPIDPMSPLANQIVTSSPGSTAAYQPLIDRYATENGLSPSLVGAVIQTESGGNPRAVSRAGAMGLMQLMPDDVQGAGISDPFDPEQNIAAGTKQLAGLLQQYGGNLDLALAGYNAGPAAVRKYGGIPPFHETQTYIQKVKSAMGNSGQ